MVCFAMLDVIVSDFLTHCAFVGSVVLWERTISSSLSSLQATQLCIVLICWLLWRSMLQSRNEHQYDDSFKIFNCPLEYLITID
jgi:hypothetical protein